jgi:hypothetical protein
MKDFLKDFDELVSYDKKRRELLAVEEEVQKRWNNAHSSATRLINQSNVQNNNEVLNYLRSKVEKGLSFWNTVHSISSFLTDVGFNELRNELLSSKVDTLRYKLHTMKEALNEFDQIQAHDAKRAELTPIQKKILCVYKKIVI